MWSDLGLVTVWQSHLCTAHLASESFWPLIFELFEIRRKKRILQEISLPRVFTQCLQSRIKLVNVLTSHYATYCYIAIYQVKCQTITSFHFLPCRQFTKIMLSKVMTPKDWHNRRDHKWIWSVFTSSKVVSVKGEWCELSSCSTMHRSKRFWCKKKKTLFPHEQKMLNILFVHFWNSLRTWEWPQVRKQFEEQQMSCWL